MRRFLLKIAYYACESTENKRSKRYTLFHKIYFNGLKLICMSLLTLYLKILYTFTRHPVTPLLFHERGPIVSLTTFPARINGLWIVLDSIFCQTYRPSKVILVLTKEEFPTGMSAVPHSLKRMLDKGLEIVFVDYNLRSHNKYYYALSAFKDRDVITLDDDLYYWSDTIQRLYQLKNKYPHCICSNRTLRISERKGNITYLKSSNSKNMAIGHSLMAQGFCGVLYVPEFRTDAMFNKDAIKELCLQNDDNWLKVQEILANIPVATGEYYPHPLLLIGSQREALVHQNSINHRSERITQNLIKHYNITNIN